MGGGQRSLPDFSVTNLKTTLTSLVSLVIGWEGQRVLGKFPRPCWPESARRRTSFKRSAHSSSSAGTRGSLHLSIEFRPSSLLLSHRAINPRPHTHHHHHHLLTVTTRALGKETSRLRWFPNKSREES